MRFTAVALSVPTVVVLGAACSDLLGSGDTVCVGVAFPAVVGEIRTADGTPAAIGATMIVQDGQYFDTARPPSHYGRGLDGSLDNTYWDHLRLGAADNRGGRYAVRVTKQYYRDFEVRGVRVEKGECGVARATLVRITLTLAPGAPPVRSVVVYPPTVFRLANESRQFNVIVDGDAAISHAVIWSSSDTSVVTASPNGVATSRCRATRAEASVIATSTVDTTRHGAAWVSVPRSSCPTS